MLTIRQDVDKVASCRMCERPPAPLSTPSPDRSGHEYPPAHLTALRWSRRTRVRLAVSSRYVCRAQSEEHATFDQEDERRRRTEREWQLRGERRAARTALRAQPHQRQQQARRALVPEWTAVRLHRARLGRTRSVSLGRGAHVHAIGAEQADRR